MTDEYLEQIRASMAESPVGLYATELLAEVDRLRAAADGLMHYVTIRRDDIRDSLKSGLLEGPERWCAAREGTTLTETLDRGRELGLFTDKP